MKNAIVGDPVIDNTGSLSKFRWIDSSIHKAAISETAWNGCTRIDELKYRLWRSFSRIEYSLLCTVVEISASPIARCWRRSILTRPWSPLRVRRLRNAGNRMTFRCRADSPTVYSRLEFLINGREAFSSRNESGKRFSIYGSYSSSLLRVQDFLIKKNTLLGRSIDTLLISTVVAPCFSR